MKQGEHDMLDRWAENLSERGAIESFMEWLSATHRVELAQWVEDSCCMQPLSSKLSDLLNDFYGIDYWRLEAQRRALLKAAQADQKVTR